MENFITDPLMLEDEERYIRLVETATGSPYRPGNRLTVYQNGDAIFPAMLTAIRGATKSIEFATYVYWRSRIASQFADALCERARAGVEVKLLVDAVGAAIMSTRTVGQLERAGVKVAWFRPVKWPNFHKINHRTHRKILIIDGRTGFAGGVGIADEWTGTAQDKRHWRETHAKIEGPACADLFRAFAENWLESTGRLLTRNEPAQVEDGIAISTTISTARKRPTNAEQLFMAIIGEAQQRLWITSAYFVPGPTRVTALVAAAERGVDVRILTNGPLSNHKVTRLAGHTAYARLLDGGVKLYEYQPTVLHSKVMTADGVWSTIGSTNLDERSLVLNDELNISFASREQTSRLDEAFLKDLKFAKAIRSSVWHSRGAWSKSLEASAGLFKHQL